MLYIFLTILIYNEPLSLSSSSNFKMISSVVRPNLLRSRLANLQARNFAYMHGPASATATSMVTNSLGGVPQQQQQQQISNLDLSSQLLVTNDHTLRENLQLITENEGGSSSSSSSSSAESEAVDSSLILCMPSSSITSLGLLLDDPPRDLSQRQNQGFDEGDIILKLQNPSDMEQLLERCISSEYEDDGTKEASKYFIIGSSTEAQNLQLSNVTNSLALNLKTLDTAATESWYDLVTKFKCPICQDVLASPCGTNCSHSYCGSCLQEYLYSSGNFDNYDDNLKQCCLCKTEIKSYIYERGYDQVICEQVYKLSPSSDFHDNVQEWSARRDLFFRKEKQLSDRQKQVHSAGLSSRRTSLRNGSSNSYGINNHRGNNRMDNDHQEENEDFFDTYGDLIFYTGAFVVAAYAAMSVIYRNKNVQRK